MNIEHRTSNVQHRMVNEEKAESPKGFVHKLRISLQELRDTQRWLKLIQWLSLIKKPELLNDILQEAGE